MKTVIIICNLKAGISNIERPLLGSYRGRYIIAACYKSKWSSKQKEKVIKPYFDGIKIAVH